MQGDAVRGLHAPVCAASVPPAFGYASKGFWVTFAAMARAVVTSSGLQQLTPMANTNGDAAARENPSCNDAPPYICIPSGVLRLTQAKV